MDIRAIVELLRALASAAERQDARTFGPPSSIDARKRAFHSAEKTAVRRLLRTGSSSTALRAGLESYELEIRYSGPIFFIREGLADELGPLDSPRVAGGDSWS